VPARKPPDDEPAAPIDPADRDAGSTDVSLPVMAADASDPGLTSVHLPVATADSLEIQFSSSHLPAAETSSPRLPAAETSSQRLAAAETSSQRLAAAAASGSLDVHFSNTQLPASRGDAEASARRRRARTTLPELAHRIGDAVVHAGDSVVDRMVRAGERAGESFAHLPIAAAVLPKSVGGRVMVKSVVVSFVMVFSWIAVIVGLQLRRPRPPDFRPLAQQTLMAVRDGKAHDVYRDASTRFQEVVLEDAFVSQLDDLNRTLGKYKEITAVLAVETLRGPGGKTGRIDFRAEYENGPTRGTLSFRWEDGRWKLLGFSVDVPPPIAAAATTQAARAKRVEGPKLELRRAADEILTLSARQDYDAIWSRAALGFQESITQENFRDTEAARRKVLGPYLRILDVTSAVQNPTHTGASIQLLIQFEKATITGSLDFAKVDDVWKLTRYKLVLPLPRVPA
jgi:hypothetical protein